MSSIGRRRTLRRVSPESIRLGQLSLSALRTFYNNPSVLSWKPRPSIDVDHFKASFRLEHLAATSYDLDPQTSLIHMTRYFTGTGSLSLAPTLEFLGTRTHGRGHQACSVSLAPDCFESLCDRLFEHSKRHFNACVEECSQKPALTTHEFAGGFEDMIGRLLKEMLTPIDREADCGESASTPDTPSRESGKGKGRARKPLAPAYQIIHEITSPAVACFDPGPSRWSRDENRIRVSYAVSLPATALAEDRSVSNENTVPTAP